MESRKPWSPPPHEPRERVEIARLGDWEVRAFRPEGVKHHYFAPRGMLHLQLRHSAAGISLLTPSRLTLRRYEVYPIAEWNSRTRGCTPFVASCAALTGAAGGWC